MARVDVNFNGRIYPIACDDGQEQRVRDVAAYVNDRLGEIKASVRSASDTHLLVMVSLVLADELFDVRAGQLGEAAEADTAAALDRLAGRIEAIATRLERS